jgi:hypothetical protein
MATIIAGGFPAHDQAEAALARLREIGVRADHVCTFRVNPPGEHAELPAGGDRPESPGAEKAHGGAAAGAAVGAAVGAAAGAAASPVLGPVAIAGGAGVGAYTGALVGALNAMDRRTHRDELRPAETLVAINVSDGAIGEEPILRALEDCGAGQVERTEGRWAEGTWQDFDPLTPPHLLDARFDERRRPPTP